MSSQKTTTNTKELRLFPLLFVADALRKNGLPASKPTILTYERKGIIRAGKHSIVRKKRIDRMYTMEEISDIISAIREFRFNRKFKEEVNGRMKYAREEK